MSPDQLLFESHLLSPGFRAGVILGYWGIAVNGNSSSESGQPWPLSYFWVAAAPRPVSPDRYYLQLHVDNYNTWAPGGCFWDMEKNVRLENKLWPKVTGPFSEGFKSNFNVLDQLYAPWDRGGLNSHPEWAQNFPALAWRAGQSDIANYLSIMFEILTSENYHGTQG